MNKNNMSASSMASIPGMIDEPGLVAKIVVLFWFSAIGAAVGAVLLSPYFLRILSSPREILLPVAASLGVLGAWAAGFTLFDICSEALLV